MEGIKEEKLTKVDPEHQKLFEEIQDALKDEIPTMNKILGAQIPSSEKKKAVELFQQFVKKDSSCEEYYNLRNRINVIINQRFGMTQEEINFMEAEEERIIQKIGSNTGEIHDLKRRTILLDADDSVKESIYGKILILQRLNPVDDEYRAIREWIIKALSLPYRKMIAPPVIGKSQKEISAYLQETRRRLDDEHYGMDRVKEHIIVLRNNQITNLQTKGCCFSLVGGVGVGKTSIAKALGKALGIPCEIIHLGGSEDPGVLTGSHGRIVQSTMSSILEAMARMGSANGILVLDEIDKLGDTPYGRQVESALLQVLDPSSNKAFRDAFLSDFPHDISNLWIVCTFNYEEKLSRPLHDRLHPIIPVDSYTPEDISIIIRRYLLPKALRNVGMKSTDILIDEEGMKTFLSIMKGESDVSGIRPIEKEIGTIVSRVNFLRINPPHKTGSVKVSFALPHFNLPLTLGPKEIKKLISQN